MRIPALNVANLNTDVVTLTHQLARLFKDGFGLENSPEEQAALRRMQRRITNVFMDYAGLRVAQTLGINEIISGFDDSDASSDEDD